MPCFKQIRIMQMQRQANKLQRPSKEMLVPQSMEMLSRWENEDGFEQMDGAELLTSGDGQAGVGSESEVRGNNFQMVVNNNYGKGKTVKGHI